MNSDFLLQIAVLVLIMVCYRLAKRGVKSWWQKRKDGRKSPGIKP